MGHWDGAETMVMAQLDFVLDRTLLCLTVDHYAGAWQDCNTSEDPRHRKLQGCDELEAQSQHKGGCCKQTVKYM